MMPLDWINALIGGLMIGLAASILLLGNGRIAGISGMLGRLTHAKPQMESLLFIFGLLVAPIAYYLFKSTPEITITSSLPILILGGVAVGVGTQMGNGCTSGHGICGNARLSKRTLIATVTFIATGIATVTIMNLIGA